MKCPHCQSLMNPYDRQSSRKCEVVFYRCTVCMAEHVSSNMITTGRFAVLSSISSVISGTQSQNTNLGMLYDAP